MDDFKKKQSTNLDSLLFDMSDEDTYNCMKKELNAEFKKKNMKEISPILKEIRRKDLYIKTLEKCEKLEKTIDLYKYILIKSGIYYDIDEALNNILYYAYKGDEVNLLREIKFIIDEINFANITISFKRHLY